MPTEYTHYELWLGSFEGENFKWKKLESFNDFAKAYAAYKKFVDKQLTYSDEELIEVWDSPRLDIELKQEDKIINWVGIYYSKVDKSAIESEDSLAPHPFSL